MKQIILIITCITLALLSTAVSAQVTITHNDFPKQGDYWNIYDDQIADAHYATTPDTISQAWDYTGNFTPEFIDSLVFDAVTNYPQTAKFPKANLGTYDGNTYTYYITSDTGFFLNGSYNLNPFSVYDSFAVYTPAQLIVPAPLAYGDSGQYIYKQVSYSISANDSFYTKTKSTFVDSFKADAFGTLTTPYVSSVPVLRCRQYTIETDSVFEDTLATGPFTFAYVQADTTTTYTFLRNGSGCIVLQISYADTTEVDARYYALGNYSGIATIATPAAFANIYPNPNNGVFTISTNSEITSGTIELFSVTGQKLLEQSFSNGFSSAMDISGYGKGVYILKITSGNGVVVRKVVVE